MLSKCLDMGQKFPVINMQSPLLIPNKHPFIVYNLANCEFNTLVDHSNFLTKSNNGALSVKMVGSTGLVQILILEVILRKCPHHSLLLMEAINNLVSHSYGQQLSCEGVILPSLISIKL